MTKNQINRLQMKKTVIATLGETAGVHAGVPALGQCCDELAEVTSTIEDLAVIQMSKDGFVEAKRTAKLQLGDAANEVAAAVVSYAAASTMKCWRDVANFRARPSPKAWTRR